MNGSGKRRAEVKKKKGILHHFSPGDQVPELPLTLPQIPFSNKVGGSQLHGATTGHFLGCNFVYRESFKGIPLLTL